MTTQAHAVSDERLVRMSLTRRLFSSPEFGALVGALVIAIFFSLIDPESYPTIVGAARILDPASTLGIMAVAVGLLMIGGEFDLSAGVMTGSTGFVVGLLAT